MNKTVRFALWIILIGLLTGLVSLGISSVETAVTQSPPLIPIYEPVDYGLVYLYAHTAWTPDSYDDMLAALQAASDMGVNTIIQTFSASLVGTTNTDLWLLFLDAASVAEVDVVAYLWPDDALGPDEAGNFDYTELKAFLDVVGQHPALRGYIGLHEPLEPPLGITDDDLRGFYTEMKSYAPHLDIVHFMGNMAYAEAHRTDDWQFSAGMCDICMIWYYPFSLIEGVPVYEAENVMPVVAPNVALIQERASDAQLWFLGQSFTSDPSYPRILRMPTAAEMDALYCLVMQEPVDGFIWYPWQHTEVYSQVLSDPDMAAQQAQVAEIYEHYVDRDKTFLPIIARSHAD